MAVVVDNAGGAGDRFVFESHPVPARPQSDLHSDYFGVDQGRLEQDGFLEQALGNGQLPPW